MFLLDHQTRCPLGASITYQGVRASNGNTSYGYNAANGYYGVFTASGILNDPSKGNHSGFIAPYPKLRSLGRCEVLLDQ
uniref:Uncharacterized protein n=1 Tax=Aegilops tauschii subsp. strangulata TaxID=200361 RepID=A0A453LU68_AEGTS